MLPPGGANETLPHMPQAMTKAFLLHQISLYHRCWGTLMAPSWAHLMCCLPRQSFITGMSSANDQPLKEKTVTVTPKPREAGWRRQRVRGTKITEVRTDQRNSRRGKVETKKSTDKTYQPENTALGILKHFQPKSQKNKTRNIEV